MSLLWSYLRRHVWLVVLALVLATINQVFSMLDPLIFRHVIDSYAMHYGDFTRAGFARGVALRLPGALGVAVVWRVAKNFQHYYLTVIPRQVGARLYSDGVRHALQLPYAMFEDQRSGETLGVLQKVRADVERLNNTVVNVLFTTVVGIGFVMVYAFTVHWVIVPFFLLTIP